MKPLDSVIAVLIVLVSGLCFGLSGCGNEPDPATGGERRTAAEPGASPAVTTENVDQALSAADEYLSSAEPEKAEAILAVLIEKAPRELRARELMGQVLMTQAIEAEERGDLAAAASARREAWAHYEAAVEIEPESAGLRHSAAMIALAAGESDAALGHFRQAGRLDPLNAQHPLYEAQILIQREEYPAAAAAIERVLALDAEEPFAHASLAVIAMEEGRFDDALSHIRQARQLEPADLAFRVQEARIHRRAGNPRRGRDLLAPLSADQRAEEGVTAELAACYGDLGQHGKAAEAWALRYERQPPGRQAHVAAVRAGEALVRAGRLEEARQWLEEARRLTGPAPEVRALEAALAEAARQER